MCTIPQTQMSGTSGYGLPASVFCAKVGEVFVFLDLNGDRYISLTPHQSRLFDGLLTGSSRSGQTTEFADSLAARGILTKGNGPQNSLRVSSPRPPTTFLMTDQTTRVSAVDVLVFAYALFRTRLGWRWMHLSRRLKVLRKPVAFCPLRRISARDAAIRWSNVFHKITPFFLTTRDTCLFRSVVMARFLRLKGADCNLVFAIRIAPFSAHCWLEHSGMALNEQRDTALTYTPILSV